jgi:hypothetical protein
MTNNLIRSEKRLGHSNTYECSRKRGARYLLTIIDNTGKSLKILRLDGGGKFENSNLKEYLIKHGIHHETITAYTLQQNGVAERFN